jgi:indole-3-glycerol phosphate synthase
MILDTIVARKKTEVAELRSKGIILPDEFQNKEIPGLRGFRKALLDFSGVSIIAEAKKASPSKGVICENFNPVDIAVNYQKNGAQAVSVLTDVDFFQGALVYLMQVRDAVELPVLRKDFIIDPLQIRQAYMHGADCILLIGAILELEQLKDFQAYGREYGMDVLVEVHDEWETEMAVEAEANIIGVNNRNLKDFSVDLQTTFRLKKMIPDEIPVISESGLKTIEDFSRLMDGGVTAALIGETLMRAGSGSDLLRSLRGQP